MRKNLGVVIGAAALISVLSGCAPQVTYCDLVLYSHFVNVDPGNAATIEACIEGECASWSAGDDKPVKIDGPIFVRPSDGGMLSVGSSTVFFDEVTLTAWNDAGVQTVSKTFPLEWTPPYDSDPCRGPASTDPISL